MPGYIIHIAVAKEYAENKNKKFTEELVRGVISPDLTKDKSKTHYGKSPAYTNLKEFITNNNIDTDYKLGAFLHLITDYLFYNKYLKKIKKPEIYEDYDKTNKQLIEKYNIEIPEDIKQFVFFKEGTTQIFTIEMIENLIKEVSNLDLEKTKQEIIKDNIKWKSYKKLV